MAKKKAKKKFGRGMGKLVPVVRTNTVVTRAHETIQEFLFRTQKTTKFILICETMHNGKAINVIETDEKSYRSGIDYVGMIEGAKVQILSSVKYGLPK